MLQPSLRPHVHMRMWRLVQLATYFSHFSGGHSDVSQQGGMHCSIITRCLFESLRHRCAIELGAIFRGRRLNILREASQSLERQFRFPSTATQQHPCMLCKCTHSNMADTCGWDSVTSQHRKHVWEDYVRACEACEHWRNISAAEHEALLTIVEWYKRNDRQEWLAKDYRCRKMSLRSCSQNMIE